MKHSCTCHFTTDHCHSNCPEQGFIGGIYGFTTTNGEHENIPIAMAIRVGPENNAGYELLFSTIAKNKTISTLINQSTSIIRSDRFPGFVNLITTYFPLAFIAYCTVHIQKNMIANSNGDSSEYWACALAPTKAIFLVHMQKFREKNLSGYHYLNSIPHEKWTVYGAREKGFTLYHKHTSNDSESDNNRFNILGIRHVSPTVCIIEWMELIQRLIANGVNRSKSNTSSSISSSTKHAEDIMVEEIRLSNQYGCKSAGGDMVIVKNDFSVDSKHLIDMNKLQCDCGNDYGIPCRHLFAGCRFAKDEDFKRRRNQKHVPIQSYNQIEFLQKTLSPIYLQSNFQLAYNSTTAVIVPSLNGLLLDTSIHPPNYVPKKGRNEKKRKRSYLERKKKKQQYTKNAKVLKTYVANGLTMFDMLKRNRTNSGDSDDDDDDVDVDDDDEENDDEDDEDDDEDDEDDDDDDEDDEDDDEQNQEQKEEDKNEE